MTVFEALTLMLLFATLLIAFLSFIDRK
ncbi:putative holin-like toxin [Halalkalibacter suaedae]